MAEFIEVLSGESKKDLDALVVSLEKVAKNVNLINKYFKKLKVPSEIANEIENTNKATDHSNALNKEARRLASALERQEAKLAMAQSKVNQELIKNRFETQQQNKIQKDAAVISSRLATEYQKVQARINQLTREYQDLSTKQAMGVKLSKEEERQLKDVTREINKRQTALKKVDSNIGNFGRNVGNYGSAWGKVGGLLRASVAAFGVYSAMDIGREIFNQVKEINALDTALLNVTETQENFNQAQEYLLALADDTGIKINTLESAYTKFYAAAKNTNLTLEETQRIFSNVTKASASMGLSTEQVEGAMRALEQMLSKGNVQAEEIRGQLGERLPGAFQILARSMGLTTKELNKQLELGNVLADEVLPKFADELAKTYDIDGKIRTVTAEQGRLSNAWNTFVRNVDEGGGVITNFFKGIIQSATFFTELLSQAAKSIDEIKEKAGETQIADELKADITQLEATANAMMKYNDQLTLNEAKVQAAQAMIDEYNESNEDVLNNLGIWNKAEREKYNAYQKNIDALKAYIQNIQDQQKAEEELSNSREKEKALLKGTEAYMNDIIKQLREQQLQTADNSKEWRYYQTRIEDVQRAIKKLKGELYGMLELDVDAIQLYDPSTIENFEEYYDRLEKTRQDDLAREERAAARRRQIIFDSFQRIADIYGIDLTRFQNLFDGKENTVEDYANAAEDLLTGVSDAIYQGNINRINAEIAANDEKYSRLIEAEEGNERKQEMLRNEQEQKRRKLERERLEQEKRSAIFNSIIQTGAAVVRALAQGGLPLAAVVGTLGAAQTALIAARPIPQYKKGRKGGKEEIAILGDGYKNEPVTDKKGNLKFISPNKPTLMPLEAGDTVHPSMEALRKASVMASLDGMQEKANDYDAGKNFERRLLEQGKQIERNVIKSLRKANFHNHNNLNIDLSSRVLKKLKYKH